MTKRTSIVQNLFRKIAYDDNAEGAHVVLKLVYEENKEKVTSEITELFKDMVSHEGHEEIKLLYLYLEGEFSYKELKERNKDLKYEYKYKLRNLTFKGFL